MRLVASTPNSKPIPETIRRALDVVTEPGLRMIVERISIPRATGSPDNLVVRQAILELLSTSLAGGLGVEVDEANNVVVGLPRIAIHISATADGSNVPTPEPARQSDPVCCGSSVAPRTAYMPRAQTRMPGLRTRADVPERGNVRLASAVLW